MPGIEINLDGIEKRADALRRSATRVRQELTQIVNGAVQGAHTQLSSVWPNPLGVEWAKPNAQGEITAALTSTDQNREELIAQAVAHARTHRHTHAHSSHKTLYAGTRSKARTYRPPPRPLAGVRVRTGGGDDGPRLVTILTRGDDKVCPICEELEGITYTLEEANEILPVHPNCRCVWVPATDLRFGPVIPDDPGEVLLDMLKKRVPDIWRLVSWR